MCRSLRRAAPLLLLATGCSWLDVAGPREVPVPAGFAAAPHPLDFLRLQVSWTAPSGLRTAEELFIEIEVRTTGGGLLSIASWHASSGQLSVPLPFDTPDGLLLQVRARFVTAGMAPVVSPYTAPIAVQHGVQAPLGVNVQRGGVSPASSLVVTWFLTSPNPDGLRLERRLVSYAGAAGPWELLAAASATATFHEDTDLAAWRDGAAYEYRVTSLVGAVESQAATGSSPPGRPRDPVGSAVVAGRDVQVNWSYPGAAPADFVVWRETEAGARQELGQAPAGSTGFVDPGPPPGLWRYGVQASLPRAELSDPATTDLVVADPAWAGKLVASVRSMPLATWVARDGSGRFALAWYGNGGLEVRLPEGAGTVSWTGAGASAVEPPVAYDPQDRLHVFFEEPSTVPGSSWVLRHQQREAGAWQVETAGTIAAAGAGQAFAGLDASGSPLLAWRDFATPASLPVSVAARRAGTWAVDSIPAALDGDVASAPAADPSGEPAILTGAGGLSLARRTPGGWTGEGVPLEGRGIGFQLRRALFLPGADQAITGSSWFATPAAGTDYWVKRRDASGWLPAEKVTTGDDFASFAIAVAPGGARIAVARNGATAEVVTWSAGAWTRLPLAGTGRGVAVGFTAQGNLWVLTGLHTFVLGAPGGQSTYVLYEEP